RQIVHSRSAASGGLNAQHGAVGSASRLPGRARPPDLYVSGHLWHGAASVRAMSASDAPPFLRPDRCENESVSADPRIVLVPGGFTGAWMWADVVALLKREGIEALAVELPTIGEESAGADFYADAASVREVIDRLEPPVLLCGHSYGGAVITEAASGPHPAVRELVYLTAAVPGVGDSMVSLMNAAPAEDADAEEEGVTIRDDGLALLDPDVARRALFNDCGPERAEDGLRRLRPMS